MQEDEGQVNSPNAGNSAEEGSAVVDTADDVSAEVEEGAVEVASGDAVPDIVPEAGFGMGAETRTDEAGGDAASEVSAAEETKGGELIEAGETAAVVQTAQEEVAGTGEGNAHEKGEEQLPISDAGDSIVPASPSLQNDKINTVAEQAQVVEKIVPAEVTEEDKKRIFRERLGVLSVAGNAARSKRLQNNHAKIIEYLKQHGYATNNEIEKLCSIADSTATKYMKELERQGLVMSVGKKGRSLRWRLREGRS